MFERIRRKNAVRAGKTDISRWTDSKNHEVAWATRAAFAAAACSDSLCVCDIGCGMQELKSLLANSIIYLPADLQQWTVDTAICDLNAKRLPDAYLKRADTVTMLGVIEYIYDMKWVLESLRPLISKMIISYNPTDFGNLDRLANGWVNSHSLGGLVRLFHDSGFLVKRLERINEWEVILVGISVQPSGPQQT